MFLPCRRFKASISWTCPEGNRPPFTKKTLTPSASTAKPKIRIDISVVRTNVFTSKPVFTMQIYETNLNFWS